MLEGMILNGIVIIKEEKVLEELGVKVFDDYILEVILEKFVLYFMLLLVFFLFFL